MQGSDRRSLRRPLHTVLKCSTVQRRSTAAAIIGDDNKSVNRSMDTSKERLSLAMSNSYRRVSV